MTAEEEAPVEEGEAPHEDLMEMVSADSTKDEFRDLVRTVTAGEVVDATRSPEQSPKALRHPLTRLSSEDLIFRLDGDDPTGLPRDVRPGAQTSGLVLRGVPDRPRAPKTARDRWWARLFGVVLAAGVACFVLAAPTVEAAAVAFSVAATVFFVEGLVVRHWVRGGASLSSAACGSSLSRVTLAVAAAVLGARARGPAAAGVCGALAVFAFVFASFPARRFVRCRGREAFSGAVRDVAAKVGARHKRLPCLHLGLALAQAAAVAATGSAIAGGAGVVAAAVLLAATLWLCGVLRLLVFAAAIGSDVQWYASTAAAANTCAENSDGVDRGADLEEARSELASFCTLAASTSLGSLAKAAVVLPAAAVARGLAGRTRRDAAPLAVSLHGREPLATRLLSAANACTDVAVAHVAIHNKAFYASAVAVDGVLSAGGVGAALKNDDDVTPGLYDAAEIPANALLAAALLLGASPPAAAALAAAAYLAGALAAAPFAAATQAAYLGSLECPNGLAAHEPLIYERLRRLGEENRTDARRERDLDRGCVGLLETDADVAFAV